MKKSGAVLFLLLLTALFEPAEVRAAEPLAMELKTGSFILTDRNFIFKRILIAKSCQICKNLCKQQVGSGRFAAGSCVPVDELLSVILGNENNRCLETGQVGRYYGR